MDTMELRELYSIVNDALDTYGPKVVLATIAAAHMGRPTLFVSNANAPYFRMYRNSVSPDPRRLVKEASESGY